LPKRSTLLWAFAPALIATGLLLRPLLGMDGLPAFVHDWSWPPDADAAWSALRGALQPVVWNGFPHLNFYTGSAAQALVVAVLVSAFGTLGGLKALAAGLVLAASTGAFAFAKRLGASSPVAAAAALTFAASPVVANQFAAGHTGVLFGYAMLPCVALCAFELAAGGRRRIAALGLLVAVQLSIGQPQFAIFDALVLAAFVPFGADARARWIVAGAAVLAVLASPYGVALALSAHPLVALGADRTNLLYERANSGAFWASHIGASYVRAYDAGAGAATVWLRAIGGAALWAFAIWNAFARRRALALLALAIGAAWICAGANGPLWPALSAGFERIPQLALFRELYLFSAPLLLALAALIALTRGARATVVAIAASVAFASPQLTGAFWSGTTSYDPAEIARIAALVSADRTPGYVLYWPLLQPLGPAVERSGADPDAYAIGVHPALSEFAIGQPLSQIDALLCDPRTDARALLARFGVRYVVVRPHWQSYYRQTLEPSLRALVLGHPAPPCAAARVLARLPAVWTGPSHTLAMVPGAVDPAEVATGAPLYRLDLTRTFGPGDLTPDPRTDWVDAGHWQWWDAGFLGPVNPGVFALGGIPFVLPPRTGTTYLVLNAPAGALLEGDKHRPIAPAPGYRALAIPESARRILTIGPAVISGYANDPQAATRRLPAIPPAPSLGPGAVAGWAVQIACWCAGAFALLGLAVAAARGVRGARA